MTRTIVCGVDGCPTGWVAVYHDLIGERLWWEVHPAFVAIASSPAAPSVIAVDIPIGLPDVGARGCDLSVRKILGRRASSVFPAPIRAVLECGSYAEATSARRAAEGKGLSRQAWAIVPKVREVDGALRATPGLRRIVREIHPELCFYHLNGHLAMAHSKKKPAGRAERAEILRSAFGGVVDSALADRPRGCGSDDLLDAFAAAWTAARIARGEEIAIPDDPDLDRFDLPMEMVA